MGEANPRSSSFISDDGGWPCALGVRGRGFCSACGDGESPAHCSRFPLLLESTEVLLLVPGTPSRGLVRSGLAFKAQRRLYYSTPGSRVIETKKTTTEVVSTTEVGRVCRGVAAEVPAATGSLPGTAVGFRSRQLFGSCPLFSCQFFR